MSRNGSTFRHALEQACDLLLWYRKQSLELAKIESARIYVHIIRLIRVSLLRLCGALAIAGMLLMTMLAVNVLVYQLIPSKLVGSAAVVVMDALITAGLGWYFMSEKRWMNHYEQCRHMIHDVYRDYERNKKSGRSVP